MNSDLSGESAFHDSRAGGTLDPIEQTLSSIMECRASMLELLCSAQAAGLVGWILVEEVSKDGYVRTWRFERASPRSPASSG